CRAPAFSPSAGFIPESLSRRWPHLAHRGPRLAPRTLYLAPSDLLPPHLGPRTSAFRTSPPPDNTCIPVRSPPFFLLPGDRHGRLHGIHSTRIGMPVARRTFCQRWQRFRTD